MIKQTLYFGNPAYLSLKNKQMLIRLPEVVNNNDLPESFKENSEVLRPVEDIGVVILDHKQITVTHGLLTALLENNVAIIQCNDAHHPIGLVLNLDGHTLQTQSACPLRRSPQAAMKYLPLLRADNGWCSQ